MAVQKNIVFKVDIEGTGKAENSIGGLEERVEKLKQLIESEPIGSKRFNELNRDLQKAQSSIKDVELQFEALDFEQKLTAGSDAIVGIAGGFAVAEGAAALFGESSEALEKTLSKVAGALALTTGLRDLANGVIAMRKLSIATKAQAVFQELNAKATATAATVQKLFTGSVNTTTIGFKALKTAIISTGIGALVVGVGLLIANFDKLSAILSSTTREQKILNEATNAAIDSIGDELSAADKLSKTLKDETKTRKEKNEAVKALQKEYPDLLSNVDAEKDSLEDINKALELNTKLLLLKAKQEAVAELRAEQFKAIIKAQTEAQTGANVGILDYIATIGTPYLNAQQLANAKTANSIVENEKQVVALDNVEAALQAEIDALKEKGAVIVDTTDKTTSATKTETSERQKLRDEMEKEAEILNRINNAKFKSINQFFEIGKDAYDGEISSIKELTRALSKESEIRAENARKLVGVQKEIADEYTSIWGEAFAEIAEMDAEAAEKRAKAEQERIDNINTSLDTATTAADGLMSLNDLVLANQIKGLKEGDARRAEFERKAFERQKKLQIAQALISAAQGVVSIFSQPLKPLPLKIIEVVSLAATTAAQISKIKATQFNGGGSGSIGSVGAGGASDGANGVPINNISNTASLIDQEQQNVTQVVVVETDITNTQNTVAAVTESATF
jgi:hypothetical protein